MSRKKQHSSPKDPHAAREAAKYENPIASREYLLSMVNAADEPLRYDDVCALLSLEGADEREALRRRLRAMVRDGQLVIKRGVYYNADELPMVEGRVVANKEGFGFVAVEEGGDVFLAPSQMRGVWHGDRVKLCITGQHRRGRREGTVVEVLERSVERIVGQLIIEEGVGRVEPEQREINQTIVIDTENSVAAENGQMVLVEIMNHPTYRSFATGRIIEVLGEYLDPGMEVTVALRHHHIPHVWPDAVLEESEAFEQDIRVEDHEDRHDLTAYPFVTIDGEDARDFDDAVFCQPRPRGGWTLYVAIADVSAYVVPGSALDSEAYQRGNSVYFPGEVIPMLPEALSNGLCSLNPQVNRLCMVCEMTISAAGRLSQYTFYPAVMRSKARLTYDAVYAMLWENDLGLQEAHAELLPHLKTLRLLFEALRGQREVRGALDFETTELQVLYDAQRKIEKILPRTRNLAHQLIEECMLCTNVAAARFLEKQGVPAIFRVHEGPKSSKLEDLRAFLGALGLTLEGKTKPKSIDYARLLLAIREREDAHMVQTMLLRSLSQAVYTAENKGHFGLAFPAYTHFTSPIRRYPDLIVHRLIRAALSLPGARCYDEKTVAEISEHCSMTERRADDATREAADFLRCEYMLEKVGETFSGKIVSVTNFGFFVQLDDVFVEGLVHVRSLVGDYFQFDATRHRLVGELTHQAYGLGDAVCVCVAKVDLGQRVIDFELEGASLKRRPVGKKARGSKSKASSNKKKAALKKKPGRAPGLKKKKRR